MWVLGLFIFGGVCGFLAVLFWFGVYGCCWLVFLTWDFGGFETRFGLWFDFG